MVSQVAKLKKLVDKVNDLGLIGVDEHHELHGVETGRLDSTNIIMPAKDPLFL